MAKNFASTGDLSEKKVTFSEIGTDLYAFTAEGDPNSAVFVGDDGCIVFAELQYIGLRKSSGAVTA